MAQTVETIRLLRIRAIVEGVERAAQEQRNLATAMQGVVKASDDLARSTDQNANKTLSGLKAWENYQRVTDDVFRAVQRATKELKTIQTASDQGRMSTQRYREELERVARALDKVGVPVGFDKMPFEQMRQQAIQTVRFREMERDLSQQVAVFDKQRLTERASMEAKAHEAIARAMPLEHARAKALKEQTEIQKWRTQGIIDETQKVALLADAQRRLNVIETAHGRSGGRFNRAELTNVSYQLNDIVTMMASGSNFSQILATQGPQLFQIVQGAGGEGGLVAGFKNLGAAIGALISPTTVAVGALVAGAGTAFAAWNSFDSSIRAVERSLLGLGRATPATAQQLSAIAEIAGAPGASLSRNQARAGVAALAGTGRIDPRLYGDALNVAKDLAIMTGQELPEAMGTLSAALADPAKGAKELDDQFNLFNATQLRTIERMAASGDRFGAAKAIVDALNRSIGQASETTSGWARIFEKVGKVASDAFDALGEDIDEVFNGKTDTRLLDSMRKAREDAIRNRDRIAADPLMDEFNKPAALKGYEDIIKRYDEEIGKLERRINLGPMMNPMEASLNFLSKDLRSLTEDFDPLQKEIEDTKDKLEALYRIFDNPLSPNLDQGRLQSGIDYQTRRLEMLQQEQQYGGRGQYDMVRDTGFQLSISGITEYGRALAEIDKRYDDLDREARRNIQSTEQLNRVLDANNTARVNEIATLERNQGMALARRVAPEMFELGDLQNQMEELQGLRKRLEELGFTAEQIEHVMGKAQAAIANYRTWAERLAEDYKLQQQEIAAVTFEQKAAVEAERTRLEAIRAGRTELEAAAAAEVARNNALARSQRMGYDALRDQRDEAALVGKRGLQRDQAAIGQRYDRLREEQGDSSYLRDAEALEKWRAAQEAIRGPLEEANDELNDQIRLTMTQANTYGGLVGAIEEAAERQRLLNEYMRAGVEITPELSAAIDDYAKRAGQLKQVQYTIREQQETFEDIKDMGKDALKGFISDLKNGKSAGEAFLNVLEKLLDKMLNMMLDSLFDPNSQKGFNFFSVLQGMFSGKGPTQGAGSSLPSLISSNPFSAMPSTTAAPSQVGAPMPPLQLGGYGTSAMNEAIAGAVPTFKQATSAISNLSGAASKTSGAFDAMGSNLGTFFTSPTSGIRHQVETYLRQGALSRGMDPDIIARGIKQESGFNPLAQNITAKESSYGVMQLNTKGGLGAVALQKGISLDPSNWKEQVDFGLDVMKTKGTGQWYGFRDSGIRDPFAAHKAFERNLTGSGGTNSFNGGGAGLDQLSQNVDQASTSFQNLSPNLDQFGTGFKDLSSTMQNGVPQLQQQFNSVPSMIGQGGQGVGTALDQTAGVIGQGANGIGGAINQLGQALSGAGGGGGGMGGLFKGLGGLFSGGVDWGSWMNNSASWTLPGDFSMSFFHSGGRVGSGAGRRSSMTIGDLIGMYYAPRYHNGTRGALKHDERYAVLQTGEEVKSRAEVAAGQRRGAGGGSGVQMMQPVVNVINAPSEPETRTNPDGSVDIVFEQFEGRLADRAKRGRGPLVGAIGSRREGNALIG